MENVYPVLVGCALVIVNVYEGLVPVFEPVWLVGALLPLFALYASV